MVMKPSAAAQIPALEVDRVGHRYGARVALRDVSLTVRQSSFTVLLGLNGAGKSTLFSLITRLYAISSGKIRIFGHDVAKEPGAGDDVAVLHKGSMLAHGTVGDVIAKSGGGDLREAFNRLTGVADQDELEAVR